MSLAEKSIQELVGANYHYASTLYYLGIKFYQCRESTLSEVCQKMGLDTQKVTMNLEAKPELDACQDLANYPIEVIVEYLKHAHNIFIKRRLPYIGGLVRGLDPEISGFESVIRDLQFVFTHFVEDFIVHIYEEEDTLFRYLITLQKARARKFHPAHLFYDMEKYSIEEFALEHASVDDEMANIRNITNDYRIESNTDLHLKVIFSELQEFERELVTHARIEDEVLFPKALALEVKVKNLLQEAVRSN